MPLVLKDRHMSNELFVGIDVSKDKLDVAILNSKGVYDCFVVPNTKLGYAHLLKRVLRQAGEAFFCVEATGSYHYGIGFFLLDKGQHVSVENPTLVKYFGMSVNSLQKTDKADARLIARYASERRPGLWKLSDPQMRELLFLSKRLDDLNKLSTQESNRLENDQLPKIVVKGINKNLKNFKDEVDQILKEIQRVLDSNKELKKNHELLTSIPSVGLRAAIGFMATFPDLSQYGKAEDLAAACGLNPRLKRSGSSVHKQTRISKQGSSHMRKLFYLPALSATRHNPIVKEFYAKLVAKGKPKKSALIACERKLIMIAYGVVKNQKPFQITT